MKRYMLFLLIVLVSLSFVSAGYTCNDGKDIVEVNGMIEEGFIDNVNGILTSFGATCPVASGVGAGVGARFVFVKIIAPAMMRPAITIAPGMVTLFFSFMVSVLVH